MANMRDTAAGQEGVPILGDVYFDRNSEDCGMPFLRKGMHIKPSDNMMLSGTIFIWIEWNET